MQPYTSNKSVIRDFYRRAVGQGDITFADQVIADSYIQHSPMAKPGKAGIMEALTYLKQMPKPVTTSKPFMRLIAEGDYVVTNLSFDWAGKQKVVVDLFRFQDGKIAEHWDAIHDQPETTLNGHPMMDGSEEAEDMNFTQVNKKLVAEFYQRVFIDRRLETLSWYVSADLIQHHPDIDNANTGLKNYLLQKGAAYSVKKVQLVISEGNFTVIQSEGLIDHKPCVFYDIFRVNMGKVVEQWSVSQIIPSITS